MTADLSHPSYPRSSTYDADWLLDLDMGPNPLWLLEDLANDLTLEGDNGENLSFALVSGRKRTAPTR